MFNSAISGNNSYTTMLEIEYIVNPKVDTDRSVKRVFLAENDIELNKVRELQEKAKKNKLKYWLKKVLNAFKWGITRR